MSEEIKIRSILKQAIDDLTIISKLKDGEKYESELGVDIMAKTVLDYITNLQEQLQQKENIIKEVREYIEEKYEYILKDDTFLDHDERIDRKQILHILEILDKERESE